MLGLVAALAVLGPPAEAGAARSRLMLNMWRPGPVEPAPGTPVVQRGDAVFRQRLLPTALRLVEVDAVDARSGEVLISAGTQLFELTGDNETGWCDTGPAGGGWRPGINDPTRPTHRCLMDGDGDGQFEYSFVIAGRSWAIPVILARRPSRLRPLAAPIAHRQVEPAEMKLEYHVSLIYYGSRPLGGRVLGLVAGLGDLRDPIDTDVVVHGTQLPRTVEQRGVRFTVRSFGEREATVDVERGLPERPLSLIRDLQITR